MKTLEPHHVELMHPLNWFKQSWMLIRRRWLAFLTTELVFFLSVFFALSAGTSVAELTPSVVLLSVLFLFVACVLCFVFGDLVVLAYSADNSQTVTFTGHIFALLRCQRSLFKMALLTLFIGAFYWVVTLTVAPDKSVLAGCNELAARLAEAAGLSAVQLEMKLAAAFLYFSVLATFSLRIFFAIPLMMFHELSYAEAQALSHRATLMNIHPMSVVLLSWSILLLGALAALPWLSLALLPLLGVYMYVAYREVFLGIEENAKELVETSDVVAGRA
ncbi:MAG: hypothetical protein OEW58_05215 [Gammaproteobacteria bacterium]|nr:hypothetical protein [Gammaproteobacteria bacterium]